MRSVAIITARGGSKRIPRKNIRHFAGQPIIGYSIKAALESRLFDEVMVSTDDDEIAAIATDFGATIPFKRSSQTSEDLSTTADVLVEVLQTYQQAGQQFAYGCCIYPTAPFVTAQRLKQAHALLQETNADTILPVTRYSFPIQRSFKMINGKLEYNWPEYALTRSQDLPTALHDCGQFYFFNVASFLASRRLVTSSTYGIEVPESEVQDIDNDEDWKIAELKFRLLNP